MPASPGTYAIPDLYAARFLSPVEFGIDRLVPILNRQLAAWNAVAMDMVSALCFITEERKTRGGSSVDSGVMNRVDQHGRAPARKVAPGAFVEYPLDKYQFNIGWNDDYLMQATIEDMVTKAVAARESYLRTLQWRIRLAIYLSSNATFVDHLVDDASLTIKRFLNADGDPIPDGPFGATFDGATETHYAGIDWSASTDAQRQAAVKAGVDDLLDKGHGRDIRIVIARKQQADFEALGSFSALPDPRFNYVASDQPIPRAVITQSDNKPIGFVDSATVWLKPWAVDDRVFMYDAASPGKPLALREPKKGPKGFHLENTYRAFPLNAENMVARFGVATHTRTNGYLLDVVNASYTDPTIVG